MTRISKDITVQAVQTVVKVQLYLGDSLYELSVEDAKRLALTLVSELYGDLRDSSGHMLWNLSNPFFSDYIAHKEDFPT